MAGGAALASPVSASPVLVGAQATQTQPVPKTLAGIEASSEAIVDAVATKDWKTVAREVASIRSAWSSFRKQAVTDGVPGEMVTAFDDALGRLRRAAKTKQGPQTAQAANDLSAATVEMLGRYSLGHPVEIGRLDVIGRQIVLDAQGSKLAELAAQVAKTQAEWDAIRADVATRSPAIAAQTDATLQALTEPKIAGDPKAVKTQGVILLEVVDAMEGLYG